MSSIAPVSVDAIDLGDPTLYASEAPERLWAALRAQRPVHWNVRPDGSGFWAITRFRDSIRIMKDAKVFRSERGMRLDGTPAATAAAAGKLLVVSDGARHANIRRVISGAFTPRTVARLEHNMRATVRQALAPALSGEPCDFTDIAAMLPVAVVCDLLGVPQQDWGFMAERTRIAFGESSATAMERLAAHADIFEYYEDLVARRRREPQDDVISSMVGCLVDGRPLSDEEIFLNCDGLISGGNETTRHAAVGGVLALVQDPSRWATWRRAQPDLLVNEILRWTSPALHVLRTPVEDVEIGGQRIRSGEPVTVWMPSANRDESAFEDATRFDPNRSPNPHIALGIGPHYCLGGALARTELRVLFEELLAGAAAVESAGPIRRLVSNLMWGYESLPVVFRG
ncbi:cytochrome P450 [Nocardia spumae]|uniref:cytochrome P450 n=1 Tax=Nocardia spumae TaxID=2887190 RepID=UPI001D14E86B|nr:cytochrome P450 [Nocardia spumae]